MNATEILIQKQWLSHSDALLLVGSDTMTAVTVNATDCTLLWKLPPALTPLPAPFQHATGIIDVGFQLPVMARVPRFILIQPVDGDILVQTGNDGPSAGGNSENSGDNLPLAPQPSSPVVLSGQAGIFQLPAGGNPVVTLQSVIGTISVRVSWGL